MSEEDYGPGCDCTELCSMGPTCPGGILAGLPDAGCWRTTDDPRTHGLNHAPLPEGTWLAPGFCAGCDAARSPAPVPVAAPDEGCECGHPVDHHTNVGCVPGLDGKHACPCPRQSSSFQPLRGRPVERTRGHEEDERE